MEIKHHSFGKESHDKHTWRHWTCEKIGEQNCHISLRGNFEVQILLAEHFVPQFFHMFGDPCMLTMACYPINATCAYFIFIVLLPWVKALQSCLFFRPFCVPYVSPRILSTLVYKKVNANFCTIGGFNIDFFIIARVLYVISHQNLMLSQDVIGQKWTKYSTFSANVRTSNTKTNKRLFSNRIIIFSSCFHYRIEPYQETH